MNFHVIQHVSFETAGLLGELIRTRGHSLRTTAVFSGEPLPSLQDFDGLIVMGGPMSIHDEAEYPWLVAEKQLIAAAIREGKRVLGICLGAQLIAAVCGSQVYRAPQKEIGWWPVKGVDGTETIVFHWHGETVDLPDGAVLLASTKACVNQAFTIGDRVLGIQFHPEVTEGIIRGMIEQEGWELEEAAGSLYVQGADQILVGARKMAVSDSEWIQWIAKWLKL
jgi:GMP synthase-like glutamine amidotransferase